jgi:LysM repeat protein
VRLAFGALLAVPAAVMAQGTPQTHAVREGDTLWSLSQQYLGDSFLWPEIYRLNTDVIEDPHWIYPGEILRLAASEGVTAVPGQDTPPPSVADAPIARVDAVDNADPNVQVSVTEDDENYDPQAPLFPAMGTKRNAAQETIRAYSNTNYRPIRRDEFYSAGFLSEGQDLPFGRVIGRVAPPQIASISNAAVAKLYTELAISPPDGASYEIGDSVMTLVKGDKVDGHGFMVIPTGIGVVRRLDAGRPIIEMRQIFWGVHPGQWVLPMEKFSPPGRARAVPVADGIEAQVLAFQRREGMRLKQPIRVPQSYFYLDKGTTDGVALGDIFELRRRSGGTYPDGTIRTDELLALAQVVHVRPGSAAAVILNVTYAEINPGVRARQVAKLPS